MLAGRKYRLKLTAEQAQMCEEFGNICRAVWNTGLEQRREYRHRGGWMNYEPQAGEMAEAKREHEWLRAAPSHILQQTLKDLDKACRAHGTWKVRWRAKHHWAPSFRFPVGKNIEIQRLNRRWARAKLPKLGWVTFRLTRPLGGEIRSATVARKGGHWFISFLVEDRTTTPERHPGTPVGVDRGVKVAATTSTGDFHDREYSTTGEGERHVRLQRRLARSKKGSKNRAKIRARMNRITARITDRRSDFCAQTAAGLTTRHSEVVLEDLRTRNMTASAKGTVDKPGKQVRQKAGLNRAILGKGWHKLELALRNAARRSGTRIVLVNPAYTSQTCHHCGHVDAKSRKSQAVFVCTACSHGCHADVNAAINILRAAGHAVPACGDLCTSTSAKQELPGPREALPVQPTLVMAGIPRL